MQKVLLKESETLLRNHSFDSSFWLKCSDRLFRICLNKHDDSQTQPFKNDLCFLDRSARRWGRCPRYLSVRWTRTPRREKLIATSQSRCPNTCSLANARRERRIDDEETSWNNQLIELLLPFSFVYILYVLILNLTSPMYFVTIKDNMEYLQHD